MLKLKEVASLVTSGFNQTRGRLTIPALLSYNQSFYYTTVNKHSFLFKSNRNKFHNILFIATDMQCNFRKNPRRVALNVRLHLVFLLFFFLEPH